MGIQSDFLNSAFFWGISIDDAIRIANTEEKNDLCEINCSVENNGQLENDII